MTDEWHALIPEPLHDAVRNCLASVYGGAAHECLGPLGGGASGAVSLRFRSGAGEHLLRVEAVKHAARNPHQYRCLALAAQAGIAPPLHYVDAQNGIAVMNFIETVPLQHFPGGPTGLLRGTAGTVRELQATIGFPQLWDFRLVVNRVLGLAERCFEPGVLDRHRDGYDRLCASIAWDHADHVASHNDPNPRNVLFDGRRLWLVDWELACLSDPYVDVAIVADSFANAPELRLVVLETWLGRRPTREEEHRLKQLILLTRLYYAGLYFLLTGQAGDRLKDLSGPSAAELQPHLARALRPSADRLANLGKLYLRAFDHGWAELNRSL
jgi:hypothetical protein